MPVEPNIDSQQIVTRVREAYGLSAATATLLKGGYDFTAAAYRLDTTSGSRWFAKVHLEYVSTLGFEFAAALADSGVPNILAPIRAEDGSLSIHLPTLPGATLMMFPFFSGENAIEGGLTTGQWRTFGSTLRAVHDFEPPRSVRGQLPVEDFSLPSAGKLATVMAQAMPYDGGRAHQRRFAALLSDRQAQIRDVVARAQSLALALRNRDTVLVPCHADIHAGNVLVGDGGSIALGDWDGVQMAPRERDLMFVIGSRIARTVTPAEEAAFFDGHGHVEVDSQRLIYFRYERIIEDLGEFGESVFQDERLTPEELDKIIDLGDGFFQPGGMLESVEQVDCPPGTQWA